MALFGENFENFETVQAQIEADAEKEEKETVVLTSDPTDKSKGKKGKLQAKSTGHTYQFQIMQTIGIPIADIKKFADPYHWVQFFPPIAIVCLIRFDLARNSQIL